MIHYDFRNSYTFLTSHVRCLFSILRFQCSASLYTIALGHFASVFFSSSSSSLPLSCSSLLSLASFNRFARYAERTRRTKERNRDAAISEIANLQPF